MVFARRPAEKMPKRKKDPPQRKFTQLDIPGLELVEAVDEDYADGYEWYALVTDLDMDARDVLPALPVVHREAVAPCAAGDRHHLHRHERKGPRNLPSHQRFPVWDLVCVAVERRRTSPTHNRARIPQIRHYPTVVPSRHRRPDDHAARLIRQSNGIIATSTRQTWLTGGCSIDFNCDF